MHRTILIWTFLACASLWAAEPVAAAWPADADCGVILADAISRPGPEAVARPLRLRLQRYGGAWHPLVAADTRVWGQVYNHGDHHGCIAACEETEAGTILTVSLRIEADPWTDTAGWARYRLVLRPGADGAVTGTWRGGALGRDGAGTVRGRIRVADPRPGWTPPAPGEHPRLLLRRADLPALRAKLATPQGERDLARLRRWAAHGPDRTDRAVALGLLHQLEEDPAHAAAARELLAADVGTWYNVKYVHGAAVRVVQGALAFDLIHDACDPEFRRRMRDVFARKLDYLYHPPVGGFNPSDGSNWSAMYRSALGLAALSVAAAESEPRPEPEPRGIPVLAGGKAPGRAVPVVPLVSGATIGDWLHAGPFAVEPGTDVLAGLGGAAAARPERGTAVVCRERDAEADTRIAFAPVPAEALASAEWADKYNEPRLAGGVEFAALTGRRYRTTTALHTVLRVDEPGVYRLDHSRTKLEALGIWLDGRELVGPDTDADPVVRLEAGHHDLTVLAAIGVVGNWEIIESWVRLVALDAEEVAALEGERRAAYEHAHAVWRALRDARDRFGVIDPRAWRWLAAARQRLELWSHCALGDAGWNLEGEAYTQHALRLALPFARAWRNVHGRSLFADDHLAATFPLYAAKTVFGPAGAQMPGYGPGGGPLGVDNWARGFAFVPADRRAACLAAWDATQALADAGKLTGPMQPVAQLDGLSAACRFIDHPGAELEPVPGRNLPRCTVDRLRGAVVCRDRWAGADDAVATWFADSAVRGGGWKAPDAGAFRLFALGERWAVRGISFGNGASSRRQDNQRRWGNLVVVPEAPLSGRGPRATGFTAAPLGPDVWLASARLDNSYRGAKLEQRPGRKRPRRVAVDLGIEAQRWFAVDYSGTCGAPVLVAIADRLRGTAGDNRWQLVTLPEHEVAVDTAGFTITAASGASLRATVVAPAAPAVRIEPVTIRHEINYHGHHVGADLDRRVVSFPCAGEVLVLLTVQRGDPPAVRVADGVASLGGRTVALTDGGPVLGGPGLDAAEEP